MTSPERIPDEVSALQRMKAGIERAEGRMAALQERRDDLVRTVSSAKARILLKPQVDQLLERIQADTHRRTIGSYERMLSALAHDVIGQDIRIRLDLTTERSAPSLDINAEHRGATATVMDGNGGSLNNVVSFGLRAIALKKSGLRFFMGLDEADCWLRPGRVELFYSVMKSLALEASMQALVITHHSVDVFEEGVTVIRLEGNERDGVTGATRVRGPEWADTESEGIRSLRLRNFASVTDVTLPMGPGITAIVADNNIGKSRFVRALRVVFYGEGENADIRHGTKSAHVEVGFERGRTLHWSRRPEASPVTSWRLTERDGSVATSGGDECSGGGRFPPEWVKRECGIGRLENMDLQLARQTSPVFLLSEPAGQRAQVLSIGRESGYLRNMLDHQRRDCLSDQGTISRGEKELAVVLDKIDRLQQIMLLKPRLEAMEARWAGIRERARHDGEIARSLQVLEAASDRLAKARRVSTLLARLPGKGSLDAVTSGLDEVRLLRESESGIGRTAEAVRRAMSVGRVLGGLPSRMETPPATEVFIEAGLRIRRTEDGLRQADRIRGALRGIPSTAPSIVSTAPLATACRSIETSSAALDGARLSKEQGDAALVEARSALKETIDRHGGACPLCGGALSIEHVMREAA